MKTARLLGICALTIGLNTSAFARTGYKAVLTAPELSLNSFGAALTALSITVLFMRRKYSK